MRVKDLEVKKWTPIVILALGALILMARGASDGAAYLGTAFLKVEKPATYHFGSYNTVLQKYVQGELVDYKALAASNDLVPVLKELAGISPERMVDDKERLAFWINAYNLLILKAVCDRYPITDVKKLGHAFSSQRFTIGGKIYTIQDIYVSQLQPLLRKVNPEALYLICGGAVGYPPLLSHAITAENMHQDIRFAAYRFLNNPHNTFYDEDKHTFTLSPLIQWNTDLLQPLGETMHEYVNSRIEAKNQYDPNDHGIVNTYAKTFDRRLNDTALLIQEQNVPQ